LQQKIEDENLLKELESRPINFGQ